MAKEKTESKLFEIGVSNKYKQPTINGQPPKTRKGELLPILVLVAFADDKLKRKEFKFYGDDTHLMSFEEMESACYLRVPASVSDAERESNPLNVNDKGWVKNPNLVIKEVK